MEDVYVKHGMKKAEMMYVTEEITKGVITQDQLVDLGVFPQDINIVGGSMYVRLYVKKERIMRILEAFGFHKMV